MPTPSLSPSPEPWEPREREALRRFVERNLDLGFRLAVVEVESPAERDLLLAPLRALVGPRVLHVDLAQIQGHNLWHELRTMFVESQPRMVVLSGVVSGTSQDYMRQLNVQRDLFVRDLKVPWILFLHPAQRVPLMTIAPDFSDYVALWVRRQPAPSDVSLPPSELPALSPFSAVMPLPDILHPLLGQAGMAIDADQLDRAHDLLSRFDLQPDTTPDQRLLRRIWAARLAMAKGQHHTAEHGLRACQSELPALASADTASVLRYVLDLSLGQVLVAEGRLSEAVEALERSAQQAEQVFGKDDAVCCVPWLELAEVWLLQGKYAEAEALLARCQSLLALAPSASPLLLPKVHSLQLWLLMARGQHGRAEALLRELIGGDAAQADPADPVVRDWLLKLIVVLRDQGKYAEAEALLRRSLLSLEAQYGKHHPTYVVSLTMLAQVLLQQGKLAESEPILRHCLAFWEQQHGPEHPSYVATLRQLAGVLYQQHKPSEAEALLTRCLATIERTLGGRHPAYAAIASDLALTRLDLGRGDEAEALAERALEIGEQVQGPTHPDVGHQLFALARIQKKLGRPQAAETAQRALDVLSQCLGTAHVATEKARTLLESLSGPVDPLRKTG